MAEEKMYLVLEPEVKIDLEKAKPEKFQKLGKKLKARLFGIGEIIEKLKSTSVFAMLSFLNGG